MALFYPFFSYNGQFSQFYPSIARSQYSERRGAFRNDRIAATGAKFSQYTGAYRVIDVTFRFVDSATLADFWTFWDAVKDGSVFTYHDDDSYYKSGTPTCGDGTICGDLQSGGASDRQIQMTIENAELAPEEEEVYNYWTIPLSMREVV